MNQAVKKQSRTIADLLAIHDRSVAIPNRIKAAIAALAASGEEWAYEIDLMKLGKPPLGSHDMSAYRDQFVEFWEEMPTTNGKSQARRVWFATKKAAKEWRERPGA